MRTEEWLKADTGKISQICEHEAIKKLNGLMVPHF
jgi:hypothetical protein